MIKLNAQGEQAPTMRTVQQNGEPVSFVDKLSALAQKAMSRLAGSSYAGGSFSRITKMIPAVMLAVFAFTTAQGQYSYNFNNIGTTPTSGQLGVTTGPTVSIDGNLNNPSWTVSGGSITRYTGTGTTSGGGGNTYALGIDNDQSTYAYTFTVQVTPGYQLQITAATAQIRRANDNGTDATAQMTIQGNNYGSAVNNVDDNWRNVGGNTTISNLTGTVTVVISGTRQTDGDGEMRLDNFSITGTVTQLPNNACTNPPAFNLNLSGSAPYCNPGTITISDAQSNTGVNYQLYRDNTAFGGGVAAYGAPQTGGPAITWSGLPAGIYTAVATATVGTGTCNTNSTNSQTVLFTPTQYATTGGGNICVDPAGGTANINLGGSQTGITYSLLRNGSPMSPAVDIAGTGSPLTYVVNQAGTYTWVVSGTSSVCPTTMMGNAVVTVGNPTVAFSATPNNGQVCASNPSNVNTTFFLTGTPSATVNYTVAGHSNPAANTTGNINIEPDGSAAIVLGPSTTSVTVTLNTVSNNTGSTGCVVTLNNLSNTWVVRPALSASFASGSETVCVGTNYSTSNVTVNVGSAGSTYERRVYWSYNDGSGYVAGTPLTWLANTTANKNITVSSGINPSVAGVSHTWRLDSIVYTDGLGCKVNLASTVTKTTKAVPDFDFAISVNGAPFRELNLIDTICMPVASVDFRIINVDISGTPATYNIVKNGGAFNASGNLTSNQSSIISGVTTPGGLYTVTVTNPSSNSCPTSKTYEVRERFKPSFTYTIGGQAMNDGDTFVICAAQNFSAVLASSENRSYSAPAVGNPGNSNTSGNLSGGGSSWSGTRTYTSPDVAVATVYPFNITVSNLPPQTPSCDSVITVYVRVNPRPSLNVLGDVKVNSVAVNENSTTNLCENTTASITVTGVPGHAVEIHTAYGAYASSNTFPSSGYTQIPTGVIGANGTYTYSFATGAYQTNTDAVTFNYRHIYRIEVKDPVTLCADTFILKTKVNQKPRIDLTYQKTEPNITGGANSFGAEVAVPVGGVITHCFPGELKINFKRNSSNTSAYNGVNNTNDISYNLVKVSTNNSVHMGTNLAASSSTPDFVQFTVNANASGTYTLYANNPASGCDSVYSFTIDAKPAPVYTRTGVSNTTICEEQSHTVTLTGNAGQPQTYTLTRTGGTGVVPTGVTTTWNGSLTAATTTINIAGLLAQAGNANVNGIHNFRLVIGSPDSNACPRIETFTLTVTKKPIPTVVANGDTLAAGEVQTYCTGETVHYTLVGIPVGTPYRLFRSGVVTPIAQGISSSVEQSVITLVQQQAIAGTYTIRLDNGNCDSAYSFQVVVNNAPNLTYISHTPDLNCYGASNGTVTYSYTANNSGTSFYTYIVDLNAADTVQIHNSNLLSQPYVQHGNLVAGDYRLILTTGNGCVSSFDFEIGQPSQINLTINGTQSACNAANGSVTFSVEGGTPGYDVVITNNTTNQVSTTFYQAAAFGPYTVSNLATGTYTVTVTDDNGCVATAAFTVNSCSAADLVPVASFTGTSNYSLANTTALPMTLEIWNLGQVASNGQIQIALMLPPNFTISSTGLSAGWTVSTSGLYTMLTSNTAVVGANAAAPVTVNANLVLNGSTSTGINALLVQLPPGTGGDAVNTNNTTNVILNVVN
jgi:hypothetical protein